MKKILLGFIAIGLLTFVGCDKGECCGIEYEENETTDSAEAKDADGYTYKTVIIGEQEWFAENLRTSKYSDGTPIPNVTGNIEWNDLETGAWCNYNNHQYDSIIAILNDSIYGKLYNWYAVETGKLCPTGWHVPTDEEWTVLTDYLTANGHNENEGKALKSTSGWKGYGYAGENGTNDYGWNGLPGGNRTSSGGFYYVGYKGYWWSSSQYDAGNAWNRVFSFGVDNVLSYDSNKENGFYVRCIRD